MVPNSEKKYCPVKNLSDFMSKADPNASILFNRCSKSALTSLNDERIWYTDMPIKHYQFTIFVLGTDLKKLGRWTRELQFCSYRSNTPFVSYCRSLITHVFWISAFQMLQHSDLPTYLSPFFCFSSLTYVVEKFRYTCTRYTVFVWTWTKFLLLSNDISVIIQWLTF